MLLKDPGRGRNKALLAVSDNMQLLRFSKRSDLWDNMLPKVMCRLPKGLSFGAGLVPKLNILDGAILVVLPQVCARAACTPYHPSCILVDTPWLIHLHLGRYTSLKHLG